MEVKISEAMANAPKWFFVVAAIITVVLVVLIVFYPTDGSIAVPILWGVIVWLAIREGHTRTLVNRLQP